MFWFSIRCSGRIIPLEKAIAEYWEFIFRSKILLIASDEIKWEVLQRVAVDFLLEEN